MIQMKHLAYTSLLMLVAAYPATSQAQITGNLIFTEPHAFVSDTESIEVRMRLTLDEDSLPFESSDADFWLDYINNNPIPGYDNNFVAIDWTYISTWYGCSGSFSADCTNGPPYKFEFNTSGNDDDPHSLVSIAPGESVDYRFGTFIPSNGAVAPGTYYFYNTGIDFVINGYTQEALDNGTGSEEIRISLFQTACGWNEADCNAAFSRTVIAAAVPEPSSYALIGLGLGILAYSARRRKNRAIQ